tara:strand:- start:2076 stop:2642 length:567 start_codon:yes stop_codon:yes gene_type:complete
MNILLLSELVNKGGTRIGGDYKIDQDNSMTTSPSEPPVTTDDFIKSTRQGDSMYMYRSFYREDDETNDEVEVPKEDLKKTKSKNKVIKKKRGKKKTDALIEDVFTKKDFDKEFVEKRVNNLNKKEIPNIDSVRDTNPILIRKVGLLKDVIEKNDSSGEEIAVILNYLLDIDLTQIPIEYKKILKNKLN